MSRARAVLLHERCRGASYTRSALLEPAQCMMWKTCSITGGLRVQHVLMTLNPFVPCCRRITNRESARRMRLKRQEEWAAIKRQVPHLPLILIKTPRTARVMYICAHHFALWPLVMSAAARCTLPCLPQSAPR